MTNRIPSDAERMASDIVAEAAFRIGRRTPRETPFSDAVNDYSPGLLWGKVLSAIKQEWGGLEPPFLKAAVWERGERVGWRTVAEYWPSASYSEKLSET
ncbi:MAG: hypothetical protein OXN18_03210 [Gemmatimonadota bacterium]|nr:hypothetical protein [Gemmatimonadota bacterium]